MCLEVALSLVPGCRGGRPALWPSSACSAAAGPEGKVDSPPMSPPAPSSSLPSGGARGDALVSLRSAPRLGEVVAFWDGVLAVDEVCCLSAGRPLHGCSEECWRAERTVRCAKRYRHLALGLAPGSRKMASIQHAVKVIRNPAQARLEPTMRCRL